MAEPTTIDLSPFCGREDQRSWMRQPFAFKGRSIALNGFILVALDPPTALTTPAGVPDPSALLSVIDGIRHSADGWTRADTIGIKLEQCRTCKGSGHATRNTCGSCDGAGEFEHWGYNYDCRACSGYGHVTTPYAKGTGAKCPDCTGTGAAAVGASTYGFGSKSISGHYAQRIRALPNAEVKVIDDGRFTLRFDGGVGLIMAFRDFPLHRAASDRADVLQAVTS